MSLFLQSSAQQIIGVQPVAVQKSCHSGLLHMAASRPLSCRSGSKRPWRVLLCRTLILALAVWAACYLTQMVILAALTALMPQVARMADFGSNDNSLLARTHLGAVLHSGMSWTRVLRHAAFIARDMT